MMKKEGGLQAWEGKEFSPGLNDFGIKSEPVFSIVKWILLDSSRYIWT